MIYLIDDKKERQYKDYSWNFDKFSKNQDIITPIYTYEEINSEGTRVKIFEDGNVILFHESFFDNAQNKHTKDSIEIRKNLTKMAEEGRILLAIFSGSKSTRSITGNSAHLPVSDLYKNLDVFLFKTRENDIDLRYILYGSKNVEIEEILFENLKKANDTFDISLLESESTSFIALNDNRQAIPLQLQNSDSNELFIDENFSKTSFDSYLNFITLEWFSKKQYRQIFIPLCFGPTLSDYNGLKLSIHLRCTETINRLTPIFIYSFVPIDFIINDEYFNILKTKNVSLIEYKKEAFLNAIQNNVDTLYIHELSSEILKLKLDTPKNYFDRHSISNEWSIYRWAQTINTTDQSIQNLTHKIQENLHFKYLKTIHPISSAQLLEKKDLIINAHVQPKILYIDDDADLGWHEIFCNLFYDVNGIKNFEYLGDELKDKSSDEIIKISVNKINDFDTDIVILDFRLLEIDFSNTQIEDKTSIRLLKKIKNEINPGIQVIIFSATNKVWNLRAVLDAGADGFISKESPENSVDLDCTINSISAFITEFQKSVARIFLKSLFTKFANIDFSLNKIDVEDDCDFNLFVILLKKQLNTIIESAKKIDLNTPSTLDIVFLGCYNFLELFKNEYYVKKINHNYSIGIEEIEMFRYTPISGGTAYKNGLFIPCSSNDKPSWFNCITAIVVDYFKICNHTHTLIENINLLKDSRNDFIHSKKLHFNQDEIKLIVDVMEIVSEKMRE